MNRTITINAFCSDDFIQVQLLKCIFILRHRQNASKCTHLNIVANQAKWTVFWETVSQYSSSMAHNQDDKSYEILNNSLLYKDELLEDWNDMSLSRTNGEVSISTSQWLPLHCLAFNSAMAVEQIKVLNSAYIKLGGNSKNNNQAFKPKVTALHMAAASNNVNLKSMKRLLEYFPYMASDETDTGQIPLHYAARCSNSVEVIELLIEAYPQGLEKKCSQGEVPLFEACRYRSSNSSQVFHKLLQACPNAVKSSNKNLDTLLHLEVKRLNCCSYSVSFRTLVAFIKTLVTACPEAVSTPDINRNTPLHIFVGNTPLYLLADTNYTNYFTQFYSVFEVMLDVCPAAASALNNEQQTPLHRLLRGQNGHRKDLNKYVPMLLDVYPEAVTVRDNDGCYPIHYAVKNDLNRDHIGRIIDGYPAALLALGYQPKFKMELTPIQISLEKYTSIPETVPYDRLALVKYLYSRCPESIHIRTNSNDTVLHNAVKFCFHSSDDTVVKTVYHMDPSAAMSINDKGVTPLHAATEIALRNPDYPFLGLENFRFLLRMCPNALSVNNRQRQLLKEAAMHHNRKNGEMLHRMLLQAVPGNYRYLLRKLNYEARRMAMFLFYAAKFEVKNIFIRLRNFDSHIVRKIVLLL